MESADCRLAIFPGIATECESDERKEWSEKFITHFESIWRLRADRFVELSESLGAVQALVKVIEALEANQKGDEQEQ